MPTGRRAAATALCAYSFAALPGDTLRRCEGGTFDERRRHERLQLGRARSLQRGRRPDLARDVARQQRRLRERSGDALRSHARPGSRQRARPGCRPGSPRSCSGRPPIPRAGRLRSSYAVDGGAPVGLRGQACSWLCGTRASGDATVDLERPRRRPALGHRATPVVRRRGCERRPVRVHASIARLRRSRRSTSRRIPPRPRPAGGGTPRRARRSRRRRRPTWSARGCGSTGRRVRSCSTRPRPAPRTAAAYPASALAAGGAYEIEVVECDGAGHCTTSSRAALRWDGEAATGAGRRPAPPLGVARRARRAHMTWPALGGRRATAASPARSPASARHPLPRARRRLRPRTGRPVPGQSARRRSRPAPSTARRRRASPSARSRARASPRARPASAAPLSTSKRPR